MQSRRHSFYETCTSTAIGFGVAIATQAAVFPLFGIQTGVSENLGIAAIFTVVSIARGYVVRRLFNWWHTNKGAFKHD